MSNDLQRIFDDARLSTVPVADSYSHRFAGLRVGGIDHHGQLNIARVSDYGGPWVATIYILVSAPNRGVATGFQHHAATIAEALDQVEQYAQDWAQTQATPHDHRPA